jgi:flagellar basal-body rod protein FlgB
MLEAVFNREGVPALQKMLAFTEARHRVLTENVANADTPGYVTKQLDPSEFQRALRSAVDETEHSPNAQLRVKGGDEFREDAYGHLEVTPTTEPAGNILFHDGTNMRIEKQMSMLAENAMMYQTASELLKNRFDLLQQAIRGTVR